MARIALAVVGAVIGGLIGGPVGAQLGFALGSALGSVLFPGKLPNGPRLNDLQVTSATNGTPIPFGYNTQRVAGNILWSPGLLETTTDHSIKGGPKQLLYSYSASFAVSFGEGPGTVGRIWFDSKIVYDPTGSTAPITGISEAGNVVTVDSTLNPEIGSQVNINNAPSGYNGSFKVTLSSPIDFSYYNPTAGLSPGTGGTASFPPPTYTAPVIYPGNETQGADPTIQAAVGAANCPAYRGLILVVWTAFPLANFGNRIPNVRAEITYSAPPLTPVTISFVQAASGAQSNHKPFANNVVVPFGSPNTGGNFIVAWVLGSIGYSDTPMDPPIVFSLTDSQGNTYEPAPQTFQTGVIWGSNQLSDQAVYIATDIKAGPNTVTLGSPTAAPNGGANNNGVGLELHVFEYTGNPGVPPVINASQFSSAGFTSATLDLTTNQANQLVLLLADSANAFPQTGFTIRVAGKAEDKTVTAVGLAGYTIPMTGTDGTAFGLILTNQLPASTSKTQPWSLAQIVTDLCKRSRLLTSQIDVSGLLPLPTPYGYIISRISTGQSAMLPLAQAYFFDGVESSGVLKFIPRGGPTQVITIPESDLGLYKDNYKISEQIGQIQDLPLNVQVLFNDQALDYQQNKTHKFRHRRIVKTRNQSIIELPLTLDSTFARQIAEKALFLAYLERQPYDFNLWKALYLLYDPSDVVQFTYEGLTFIARIVKSTIGADFQVVISAVNENASTYQSVVIGSSGVGVIPAGPNTLPDTVLFMFDIPLLRDSDSNPAGSGYYVALGTIDPPHWPGATLEKSSDDINYAQQDTSSVACQYGTALSALPAPSSPWDWDTVNTLRIAMTSGTLAGASDLNVLNGANALMCGKECIQFANALQNPDGTYTIGRLLRGRRGTDVHCGDHATLENIVALNPGGVLRETVGSSELQVLRYFRPVTYGGDITLVPSTQFTDSGNDLRPYAVTSVADSRSSGDLTVTWIRRTRIGGDWLNFVGQVPLSETLESYDVDILNGSTVVRTFPGLSSPQVIYTAAQQIADFGSVQPLILMNIYQNSSVIGRGFQKQVML